MRLTDFIPLGGGAFDLEKGGCGQNLGGEDLAKLEVGGIHTAFTPKEPTGSADVL